MWMYKVETAAGEVHSFLNKENMQRWLTIGLLYGMKIKKVYTKWQTPSGTVTFPRREGKA